MKSLSLIADRKYMSTPIGKTGLYHGPTKMASLSLRPVVPTRGEISRLRSVLPSGLRIGRIFELGGKTVIMQKGLSKELTDAVESTLASGVVLLQRVPERELFFVDHSIEEAVEVELRFSGRTIKFPEDCSPLFAKRQVLCELAEFLPDVRDDSIHLVISAGEASSRHINRHDEMSGIRKKLDLQGYCLSLANSAFSKAYDDERIKTVVSVLPKKAVEELRSDQILDMTETMLKSGASGGLKVSKRTDPFGASIVEVMLLKEPYFGVTHDIVSVFASIDLEPVEMRFYPLSGEDPRMCCVCRARFVDGDTGTSKTASEIENLMDADAKNRAALLSDGDRLWFSFVGLYNAMSRFLAAAGSCELSPSQILAIMKKNEDIMRGLLSVLRENCDPSFSEEIECRGCARNEADGLENAISLLPEKESLVMRFCLDFAMSVRKTDYFDNNRLKEISSFLLSTDKIKRHVDNDVPIRPEKLLYIYRRSHGIELHPIYAAEQKTKTERYSTPEEISTVTDRPMSVVLGPHVRNARQFAAAKVLEIMPSLEEMNDRELSIFASMRFIDEEGRTYNISSVPKDSYFSTVATALFSPPCEDGLPHMEPTYMEDISRVLGSSPVDIDRVSVKFLGRGGLRTVSTVKVHSGNSTSTFLAAANRTDLRDSRRGHAAEEFEAITEASGKTGLLPAPFGFVSVPVRRAEVGVLFKEFLMGLDCEQYLRALSKEKGKKAFFRAIGKSLGQLYAETGMGSSDYKLSNMVFFRDGVRFCDICPFTDDMGMVMTGFSQLFAESPSVFKADLVEGIMENGDHGREFMGRLRDNMSCDNEDAWESSVVLNELDAIASSKGISPATYYKWQLK
jgi:hypothetical protein